jgi:hypothetical protein
LSSITALQPARVFLLRVLGEHRPQHVLRLAELAAAHELLGLRGEGAVAPVGLDLGESGGGARVRLVVRQDAPVERLGGVEALGLPQRLGLRQPLRSDEVAHAVVLGAQRDVLGVLARGLLQHRERLVAAAVVEALARVVDRRGPRGAGREQEKEGETDRLHG